MSNWAVVENNTITEFHDNVPDNWRHVSGLNLSSYDIDFMKNLGWFPIVKKEYSYSLDKEEVSFSYRYDFNSNDVFQDVTITPKENIITDEIKHKNFMVVLSNYIEKELSKTDRTQMLDFANRYGSTLADEWGQYRDNLRDLIDTYENTNVIHIGEVILPKQPYPNIPR
jgi:hypothetical protein